jgi:putative pyruvate formate lyase activating enzyme
MYERRFESNEITRRSEVARERLRACDLCPHRCLVDRLAGETGRCGVAAQALVGGWGAHWGEEAVLVGDGGSGAVFFGGCNLGCVFCQNWELSSLLGNGPAAEPVTDRQLADIFLDVQAQGCVNLNLVTPSHVAPQILAALALADGDGFHLPVVYNSSGYDRVETLDLFHGVVAIYLPDVKFARRTSAARYTNAPDYPQVVRAALAEMHRQVGDLRLDAKEVAVSGLLVRYLVMPDMAAEASEVLELVREVAGEGTYLNIMGQYRPCHRAADYPEIARPVNKAEVEEVRAQARRTGLRRLAELDVAAVLRRLFGQ